VYLSFSFSLAVLSKKHNAAHAESVGWAHSCFSPLIEPRWKWFQALQCRLFTLVLLYNLLADRYRFTSAVVVIKQTNFAANSLISAANASREANSPLAGQTLCLHISMNSNCWVANTCWIMLEIPYYNDNLQSTGRNKRAPRIYLHIAWDGNLQLSRTIVIFAYIISDNLIHW